MNLEGLYDYAFHHELETKTGETLVVRKHREDHHTLKIKDEWIVMDDREIERLKEALKVMSE